MKRQEKALLHSLFFHASEAEQLLQYLPSELADEITKWPTPIPPDFSKLLSQDAWTDPIHFSWFAASLQNLSVETQQIFLSLLDTKKAHAICKLLGITQIPTTYAAFMRPFLMDEFKQKIYQGVGGISEDHVPPSDLNALLLLSKSQLLNLVDLLGVHDLSTDLRQIVDKESLKKIHSALSAEQVRFLHYCLKQPMKWISPKLGLSSWDGTNKTLQHMLHVRGLHRLGRALYMEDESLTWHLLHRFDTGRAQVIEKILRQKQDTALTPYFKRQVLHIVNRYQK